MTAPSAYGGYVEFLHHPTFPREATCGDFFAVWCTLYQNSEERHWKIFSIRGGGSMKSRIAIRAPRGRENDVPVITWIHPARCKPRPATGRGTWRDVFIVHMWHVHQSSKSVSTFREGGIQAGSINVFSKISRRQFGHCAGAPRIRLRGLHTRRHNARVSSLYVATREN